VTRLTKDLNDANAKITALETDTPAGGNNGKKTKSGGDAPPDGENRAKYSWEIKKEQLNGSAKK